MLASSKRLSRLAVALILHSLACMQGFMQLVHVAGVLKLANTHNFSGHLLNMENCDDIQTELANVFAKAGGFDPHSNIAEKVLDQFRDAHTKVPAKFHISEHGMLSEAASMIVRQQLELDGKMSLNLASFVTTTIDPEALRLCEENLTKNLADNDEYPALIKLHGRCVNILGNLWNKLPEEVCVGSATTGSSEAIQLGGLAMKRRWEAQRKAKGKPIDKPNVVYAANAHVSIEKFARFWDVEARVLPVHAKNQFGPSTEELRKSLDENTIGVFVIQGSTYTGHFVDVEAMAKVLDDFEQETGVDISIHVDGASGGFVAPFCYPELKWDFRIPRVRSINTSGHKFGLAPVGLGWIIFRDRKFLPESLEFSLAYLGGSELTFTLNFSRPGHPVIAQYYLFLKEGYNGYRGVHTSAIKNARVLSVALEQTGYFEVLTDIHRPKGTYYYQDPKPQDVNAINQPLSAYNPGLSVVAFRFSEEFRKKHPEIPLEAVSYMLRYHAYIIPCYNMPDAESEIEVLRVVVNPGLTLDVLNSLIDDIGKVMTRLKSIATASDSGAANIKQTFDVLSKVTLADNEDVEDAAAWKHAPC